MWEVVEPRRCRKHLAAIVRVIVGASCRAGGGAAVLVPVMKLPETLLAGDGEAEANVLLVFFEDLQPVQRGGGPRRQDLSCHGTVQGQGPVLGTARFWRC